MESNDSLNNIDAAFNTYKQQLKYSGSILANEKLASHQKLLSTKQKFLTMNAENSFEILLSDSFNNKKPSAGNATNMTTTDIYVDDQKLSPTSSTSFRRSWTNQKRAWTLQIQSGTSLGQREYAADKGTAYSVWQTTAAK